MFSYIGSIVQELVFHADMAKERAKKDEMVRRALQASIDAERAKHEAHRRVNTGPQGEPWH